MNRYLEVLNESFDKVVIALNDKEGRAEVHVVDLVKQDEMLGGILLSIHNLHYLLDLMRRAREAVLADAYAEFEAQWMASPAAKDY